MNTRDEGRCVECGTWFNDYDMCDCNVAERVASLTAAYRKARREIEVA